MFQDIQKANLNSKLIEKQKNKDLSKYIFSSCINCNQLNTIFNQQYRFQTPSKIRTNYSQNIQNAETQQSNKTNILNLYEINLDSLNKNINNYQYTQINRKQDQNQNQVKLNQLSFQQLFQNQDIDTQKFQIHSNVHKLRNKNKVVQKKQQTKRIINIKPSILDSKIRDPFQLKPIYGKIKSQKILNISQRKIKLSQKSKRWIQQKLSKYNQNYRKHPQS